MCVGLFSYIHTSFPTYTGLFSCVHSASNGSYYFFSLTEVRISQVCRPLFLYPRLFSYIHGSFPTEIEYFPCIHTQCLEWSTFLASQRQTFPMYVGLFCRSLFIYTRLFSYRYRVLIVHTYTVPRMGYLFKRYVFPMDVGLFCRPLL